MSSHQTRGSKNTLVAGPRDAENSTMADWNVSFTSTWGLRHRAIAVMTIRQWLHHPKFERYASAATQHWFDEEQPMLPDKLPWRKLAKPMVCLHLWKARLTAIQQKGTHLIQVRATNSNGQILKGERTIAIE